MRRVAAEAVLNGHPICFPIAQGGAHWGPNSLATVLTVEALGAPVDAALSALSAFAPLSGRGRPDSDAPAPMTRLTRSLRLKLPEGVRGALGSNSGAGSDTMVMTAGGVAS